MKKRFFLKSATLMIACVCLVMLLAASASAQRRAFTITPIATPGDRIDGGGHFMKGLGRSAVIAGPRALNNRGDVVVNAAVNRPCSYGTYLIADGRIAPVVDDCHPSSMGLFSGFYTANVNESRQVLLSGQINLGDHFAEAFFIAADGKLAKIVADSDPTPMGTTFAYLLTVPFPSSASINNHGEAAFFATSRDASGNERAGVFVYEGTGIRKIIADGDATLRGGKITIAPIYAQSPRINDRAEVLFYGYTLDNPEPSYAEGFYLATPAGVVKVVETQDRLPNNRRMSGFYGTADLNNRGEVAFLALAFGIDENDNLTHGVGMYVSRNGEFRQYVYSEDTTPIGGKFVFDPSKGWMGPRLNDRGVMAFDALVSGGTANHGIFLASETAVLKVVADGDSLPSGETMQSVGHFAFNDQGQIAFIAYGEQNPLGVFLATPVAPKIKALQLKRINGALELRVNGAAMIAHDSIIEINGAALASLDYPISYREDGGTTKRVVSRDPRLAALLRPGQTAQVTVYNPLTNQRSHPVSFTP